MGRRSLGGGELTACLLALFVLLCPGTAQKAQPAFSWKTLSGNAPVVIAKGGFSGVFPDSSIYAYKFAIAASSSDTIVWCDMQLTKDGVGICAPDIDLSNCTDISQVYPNGKNSYVINGMPRTGWFALDYNSTQLQTVGLVQSIWSRTNLFDFSGFNLMAPTEVGSQTQPNALWLNVQYGIFYQQQKLNMRDSVISVTKSVVVNYISSPELYFLGSIANRVNPMTKLVFRFLDKSFAEPSTNQTYGSLLKNLTFIKTFNASGILVPKGYIWPVNSDNYLLPYTSVVKDAHKAGLEIYAADFANDNVFSYNYSYDPLAEYLSFIDNGAFSVDGVLTDYPITPSEAIGCFSNLNKSTTDHGKPLIISHNGASGDYPDCTDLAYQNAVDDGADVIDCSIQVTQDGVAVCMSSIDLMDDTTVAKSQFSSRTSLIPAIKSTPGIFTFNLTWDDIKKNLQPKISEPESSYFLERNPAYQYKGNFFKLSDFLAFAKDKDLFGILITIEYAAFMADQLGFGVVDAVITALSDAGYNNQTALEVMVQSTDSSVLVKFKQQTKYKLVYMINQSISDAAPSSLTDIKKFADAVAVDKLSIFPQDLHFVTNETNLATHLKNARLPFYVYVLRNEFVSQPWDFFADPTVEINAYAQGVEVDGIITDFPLTARRYKRNSCTNMGDNEPSYMGPVEVGALMQTLTQPAQPPAISPMPVLNVSDVMEPPLPPVAQNSSPNGTIAAAPSPRSAGARTSSASMFVLLAMISVSLLI